MLVYEDFGCLVFSSVFCVLTFLRCARFIGCLMLYDLCLFSWSMLNFDAKSEKSIIFTLKLVVLYRNDVKNIFEEVCYL